MVLPMKPFKQVCKSCGWSKIVAPLSDAMSEVEGPVQVCPQCGKSEFTQAELGFLEKLMTGTLRRPY